MILLLLIAFAGTKYMGQIKPNPECLIYPVYKHHVVRGYRVFTT